MKAVKEERPDDEWFITAALENACRAEEHSGTALKLSIVSIILSVVSIILHFV